MCHPKHRRCRIHVVAVVSHCTHTCSNRCVMDWTPVDRHRRERERERERTLQAHGHTRTHAKPADHSQSRANSGRADFYNTVRSFFGFVLNPEHPKSANLIPLTGLMSHPVTAMAKPHELGDRTGRPRRRSQSGAPSRQSAGAIGRSEPRLAGPF